MLIELQEENYMELIETKKKYERIISKLLTQIDLLIDNRPLTVAQDEKLKLLQGLLP